MCDEQLNLLYRDQYLVAVDKPAGLLVHPSMIDRHETRFAMKLLRDQIGQWVYPVHRLDKPTSGVLLFALSPEMAREMTLLFEQRRVRKTYIALVRGYCEAQGLIDHALKEKPDRLSDRRADPDKPAQPAVTAYRRLARVELPHAVAPYPSARYSLLELNPETGRKHQIRRHLKHISHPVVGDTSYGKSAHNRLFQELYGCRRLLLAALELAFSHPVSGQALSLRAPPRDCFGDLLRELDWRPDTPELPLPDPG